MKRTKEQKGITLIALVVTIIVLLILAGVTLSAIMNDGIISKAKEAAQKYSNEAAKEQLELQTAEETLLANMEPTANSLIRNVSIGDYIRYNPTLESTGATSYTSPAGELVVGYTPDYNIAEYIFNGIVYDNVVYNDAYKLLDEDGNYNATGYNVQANVRGNGYKEQNFTATSSNNLWRVLDDGKTSGVVKIVYDKSIKNNENGSNHNDMMIGLTCMGGINGYISGSTEYDNICAIFGHGKGAQSARSITMEDINNLTGFTIENSDAVNYYNSSETVGGNVNKSWKTKSYNYNMNNYLNNRPDGEKIKSMLGGQSYSYVVNTKWSAATSEYGSEHESSAAFGYFTVSSNSVICGPRCYEIISKLDKDTDEYIINEKYSAITDGVKPVVTLKPGLEYKSGSGTSSDPWVFQ